MRYGPFLAQVVVTRRCNLSCTYCSEFDKVSEPVPTDVLIRRFEKLRALRCWAVCFTGGEPTLHPDLMELTHALTRMGFRRRILITNGYKITPELVNALNEAGLTDLQVSVDGVEPNEVTKKVLRHLRGRLQILAQRARFRVVMNGVIGSAPPAEAIEVVTFARDAGFVPRIQLIHNDKGLLELTPEELRVYRQVTRVIGRRGTDEAHGYRARLIADGEAPFKCRAGARYLYVDEEGDVCWCSQTRDAFRKPLLEYTLEDLRTQFHTPKGCSRTCTVGCVRTASAWDEWRTQKRAATS